MYVFERRRNEMEKGNTYSIRENLKLFGAYILLFQK